jgi:hypothetical protein
MSLAITGSRPATSAAAAVKLVRGTRKAYETPYQGDVDAG